MTPGVLPLCSSGGSTVQELHIYEGFKVAEALIQFAHKSMIMPPRQQF